LDLILLLVVLFGALSDHGEREEKKSGSIREIF